MSVDVIVGLQRGDEGKGRFVDLNAPEYDIVARGNGGANAGHTVVPDGAEPLALHQIPSGIAYSGKLNVIGNGVYLDPLRLGDEIAEVRAGGREVTSQNLLISNIAQLVLPHHVVFDELRESGGHSQGSTKAGIAYVACAKYLRDGVRVEDAYRHPSEHYEMALEGLCRVKELSENLSAVDAAKVQSLLTTEERARVEGSPTNHGVKLTYRHLTDKAEAWAKAVEGLKEFEGDAVEEINSRLDMGQKVLAEGAQGFWLDINHGMYPMVTSSSTTTAGLLDGLGLAPQRLGKVTGVAKITRSHVGGGPFVTEIHDKRVAARVRGSAGSPDGEYGTTTGRPRRVGYPDFAELRSAIQINGVDDLIFCKMDKVETYGRKMHVALAYLQGGNVLLKAPSSARQLDECEPLYVLRDTWPAKAICSAQGREDIPAAAQKVLALAEETLGVNIPMIGVGYERNQVIRL